MALFKFKNNPVYGNYNHPSSSIVGSLRKHSNIITSQLDQGGNYNINRMNPVSDRLDQGSVVDDWIGKDAASIDKMYRLIYLRDSIAGPTVDLSSRLPWSSFVLSGIKDNEILKVYQDACDSLDILSQLPSITREYLTIGRQIISLIFDSEKGIWTGMIPHDPDMLRIEPRPVHGFDPKVDLKTSPAMRKFIQSQDPRDLEAKETIPVELIEQLNTSGFIPLEPENTLYVMRKVTPYDYIGTSYLTRIVPYWALEKALISNTVIKARRRTRELLHITAGIDGVWEPTSEEMDYLSMLFIQADEDPNGGAVATRTGVTIDQVGDASGGWKISDDADFLANGKMRALGINEAFLAKDASYSTLEAAISLVLESLRALRDELTNDIFYRKLFRTLGRVHEFYKTTRAEIDHRIRIKRKDTDDSKLIIPTVTWSKPLRPEADSAYIDILKAAEESGVPITLKTMAAASGVNLDSEMAGLEEDAQLRKKIADIRGEEAEEAEASILDNAVLGGFKPMVMTAVTARKDPNKALKMLPLWDRQDKFLQLDFIEAEKILAQMISQKVWKYSKRDGHNREMLNCVKANVDGNQRKTELMTYVLARCGFGYSPNLCAQTINDIAKHIITYCKNNGGNTYMELRALRKLTKTEANYTDKDYSHMDNMLSNKNILDNNRNRISLTDPIPRNSSEIFSGIRTI